MGDAEGLQAALERLDAALLEILEFLQQDRDLSVEAARINNENNLEISKNTQYKFGNVRCLALLKLSDSLQVLLVRRFDFRHSVVDNLAELSIFSVHYYYVRDTLCIIFGG